MKKEFMVFRLSLEDWKDISADYSKVASLSNYCFVHEFDQHETNVQWMIIDALALQVRGWIDGVIAVGSRMHPFIDVQFDSESAMVAFKLKHGDQFRTPPGVLKLIAA